MRLIDTHVHLQMRRYAQDLDEVLQRAAQAGVTAAIIPGTTLEDSRSAVDLAERYAAGPCQLYAAVGIHPTEGDRYSPTVREELRALAQSPRVVAIGEIGLDYYWPSVPDRGWPCASPARQREVFQAQLDLAAELSLPVIIHDRDAHADTLDIFRAWVNGGENRRGTWHAYAAGPSMLDDVLALGGYIGMDGPVTFKKAKKLHAVAQAVPLERLLLETDGPYLTPHPFRGRRNEPAYLTYIAAQITTLRGCLPDDVASSAAENACRLFNLSLPPDAGESAK